MTAYGFFAAAGAVTAISWLRARRRGMGLSENDFWSALWWLTAGAIVGAKALFLALGWRHYVSGELRFWKDFGTGFVFFGGLFGAALVGGLFARLRRLSFLRGADFFAVALPLGHAIGRLGCYCQGCCGGRHGHPVQLYESAGLLFIAWIVNRALNAVEGQRLPRGSAFFAYLVVYGLLRLMLDPMRADGRPERFLGLSHQQGIALGLMLAGIGGAAWLMRGQRPVITASAR